MPCYVGKQRLLKLADLLEEDSKNKEGIKFDLTVVAVKSDEEQTGFKSEEVPELSCGTAACAVGLACISGAFKRSGLSYKINNFGVIQAFKHSDGYEELGWSGVESFFDLNTQEIDYLFMPDAYPQSKLKGAVGERYVANRIRNFVAEKIDSRWGGML